MKASTRSNRFRVFRSTRAVMATCVFFLASCSPPPTLDSVGGVVLEFAVDESQTAQPPSKEVLARSISVIRLRLDPSGAKGVTVRVTDEGRLEVGLPAASDRERKQAIALVTRQGSLEFAILANTQDHKTLISAAMACAADKDEVELDGKIVAVWHLPVLRPDGKSKDLVISKDATREVLRGGTSTVQQFLLIRHQDSELVTGQYLTRAKTALDDDGNACINLTFNQAGARRLLELTRKYSPAINGYRRQLAILFDGRIDSAPNINSAISNSCQITGNFNREELQNLVDVLNAGVLEIPLNPTPVSERVVDPKKVFAPSEKK